MTAVVTNSEQDAIVGHEGVVVNDVVIKIATINGSGSTSANLILLQSIFKTGVPVSGKNLFPSNIAGLPTWFTIRANDAGWLGQRNVVDICIAMNGQTIDEDLEELAPGAILVLNESLKHQLTRDDLNVIMVPFAALAKEACPDTRIRKKVVNVIYVGVMAQMLGISLEKVEEAISQVFGGKEKAVALNMDAARAGFNWAAEASLFESVPFNIEPSTQALDKIIIEGNEATALGLMFGGVSVLSWYPITPSSSVCENLEEFLHRYRRDPETDKATYAVVQAEDEIASIGMVLGAGWAGARACTATSGPGISLMAEMAGLSFYGEIPAVIVDVQRMGPSTGLPTRTAQADILSAYNLSHGDCRHPLLIPGTMEECFLFGREALNVADEFQTLVFLMTDLDMGMNKWMVDPFQPLTEIPQRKNILSKEDLEKASEPFRRYADAAGDGIPNRTLPGTDFPEAAYVTRGSGHDAAAIYTENPARWKEVIDRIAKKFETLRVRLPEPVVRLEEGGSKIGIIAYGSSEPAVEEARHLLRERHDIGTDYMRIRALPLHKDVGEFIAAHDRVYLVEQNKDAQVAAIVKDELPEYGTRIRSVLYYYGLSIDAETIVSQIQSAESA